MDISTVSNAVGDALAGLPSGASDFISANIGTSAGQQAIAAAGASLGLSNAQIAAAVNQVTGMSVTPQQVAQVASTVAPSAASVTSAPAQTTLANIASPQFVGSAAPGAVGTNYGQASGAQIASAQQAAPDVATALQNGTAKMTYDGQGVPYLYDAKTGQQIAGNYQIQVGQNGQIGINLSSGNGSMVQVATTLNQDGSIPAVTASNVLNTGVNKGAGGFAGGVGALGTIAGAAAAILNPALIPYIAAYNSADAASKGKYGAALLSAGVSYAGFNPDSALAQAVKSGQNIPTDASGAPTLDASQPAGTQISQVGDVTNNPAWNGTTTTPNGAPINTTGLNQNFGLSDSALSNATSSLNNASVLNGSTVSGYTSGWQTLPDGTRVMIQNDGTGISIDPNTGQQSALTNQQVNTLTQNGVLNSAASGYNAATGGTSIAPGGGTINSNGTTTLPNGSTVTTPLSSIASGGGSTATNALGLTPIQTAAAGVGLASALGTLGTNKAISNAANTQATAANNVNNTLSGFYDQYAQAQQPYQNLGSGAVQQITNQAPYLTHQFNATDLQAGLAPNYDFMLQQGQRANQNAANASGGLLSGNTLQGMQNYTQNYAQNAYQNAFNNYQTQRQNIYGNLSNAAGLGQTSLGQLGQVGSNLAQTYGNVTTGLAASQAGAQTAQAVNNANLLSNLAKTGTVIALA